MDQSPIYGVLLAVCSFALVMLIYGAYLLLRDLFRLEQQDRRRQAEPRTRDATSERAFRRDLLTEHNKAWIEKVTSDL